LFTPVSDSEISGSEKNDSDFQAETTAKEPQLFTQSELSDLVRELGIPKDLAEILRSRLREKNMVRPGTSYCWYRCREEGFIPYFSQEGPLVYCNNCPELVHRLGLSEYDLSAWRLFIETSKRSLKGVLLHNGNVFGSAPVAPSVFFKESYENLETPLSWIKCKEHNWQVCGDFKILSMLLDQQSGYIKYVCFTCEWDSRARSHHWIQ
jgi:hypothetical protein